MINSQFSSNVTYVHISSQQLLHYTWGTHSGRQSKSFAYFC